jgi:transaldolase
MGDPLLGLTSAGVAIWLDDLSRARLATASLAGLVRDCHVVGVTSNPTIFPAYPDTRYVVDLVTHGMVNSMPEATLHAVADHGFGRGDTIGPGYHDAAEVMTALTEIGVDHDDVVDKLERDGLTTYQAS